MGKIYALDGRETKSPAKDFYNNVVLNYDGDECLIWPFYRCNGYARYWLDGKLTVASRVLCEHVNGPPPNKNDHAAHTCGKGHMGCVTKRHMKWKTAKQNKDDTHLHGTDKVGSNHHLSKLTEKDAAEILRLKGFLSQKEIAVMYGITFQAVSLIHTRKRWIHVSI